MASSSVPHQTTYVDPATGKTKTANVGDTGFGPSSPANSIKQHSPSGVLGGAHMGGHSDVAAPKPVAKKLVITQLPAIKKPKK